MDPTLSAAVYPPVTVAARPRKSRPMMTGLTTLPIVMARPSTRVPNKAPGIPPVDRISTPIRVPNRDNNTERSTPSLAINADAPGAANPKHSTGRLVSTPIAVADIPSSECSSPVTIEIDHERSTQGQREQQQADENGPAESDGAASLVGVVMMVVTRVTMGSSCERTAHSAHAQAPGDSDPVPRKLSKASTTSAWSAACGSPETVIVPTTPTSRTMIGKHPPWAA